MDECCGVPLPVCVTDEVIKMGVIYGPVFRIRKDSEWLFCCTCGQPAFYYRAACRLHSIDQNGGPRYDVVGSVYMACNDHKFERPADAAKGLLVVAWPIKGKDENIT